LDAGGRIRYVHTGFDGPATGSAFERQKALLQNKINALLAE
jgi:hypothetical protein